MAERLRILAIRPEPAPQPGGDEVVYRKTLDRLRRTMDVDELYLRSVGKVEKIARIALLNPPECTRFISAANMRAVSAKLAGGAYDAALLCNEVSFAMLPAVKAAGVPAVLSAHNLQSIVAATDPSPLARALRPLAVAFERRWYADPAAELVVISELDRQGLAASGVHRARVWVSPPGAPPAAPLAPHAPLLAEAVLTGSFGWWRKRRDVAAFAQGPALPVPVHASDPLALELMGAQATDIAGVAGWSWSAGIRFGLIVDRFGGGFKLKSLEYVANNCIVLALADISAEFEGLPHAGEFVRCVKDKAAVGAIIAGMLAARDPGLPARFAAFKAACIARFDWDACVVPMADAIRVAAGPTAAEPLAMAAE